MRAKLKIGRTIKRGLGAAPLLAFVLCGAVANGQTADDDNEPQAAESIPHQRRVSEEISDAPMRVQRPGFIGVSFGDPSPSWIGAVFAYQPSWILQFNFSAGFFKLDGLQITSLSGGARFHLLPTNFTPFVGAGVTGLFISGDGQFQGLHPEAWFDPYLSLGLDWIFHSGFRVVAGVNFGYVYKLTFPFIEMGASF